MALAIEVADTCVAFDLSRKAALYAHARVPEYWVLDLPRRTLVAHSDSDGSQYRRIQLYAEADFAAFGEHKVRVGELLPDNG